MCRLLSINFSESFGVFSNQLDFDAIFIQQLLRAKLIRDELINSYTWPQLGGTKGGGAPLNKNSAPQKCPACPPKLPFPLRQFQDGGFF